MSASYLVSEPATNLRRRFSSLSLSSVTALGIRLMGAGGLFLSHLVLVRSLGVTGFGEYAEAIAWLQVACIVGKFGFDNASLRFVSEYSTNNELARLHGFRRYSMQISFVTSFIVAIVLACTALACRNSIGEQFAGCLLIAAAMIPIISSRQIQEASLRGVGRLIESQIGTAIWPTTIFLLAGSIWVLSPDGLSSPMAMILHLISVATVSLLVYRFLCSSHLRSWTQPVDQDRRSQWLRTATAFLLAELLVGFKSRVCILMAGRILGSDSAGIYAAMDRFAEVAALGGQSLGFVIAPQFASLFAAGRYSEMRRLMRQGSLMSLAFTFPVAIAILCSSDLIFEILGPAYQRGWYLLLMLLISMCVAVLAGPSAYLLQMTGRERTMLVITGLCAVTNVLLGFLLIGPLGIEGLGVSQIITSCVWTIGVRACIARHPAWNSADSVPASVPAQDLKGEASI